MPNREETRTDSPECVRNRSGKSGEAPLARHLPAENRIVSYLAAVYAARI